MWCLVLMGCHGRKLIVISPGEEEAGGWRKTEIIHGSGMYKASAQPQEFKFWVHLDWICQNISVVTNDLVGVNAKNTIITQTMSAMAIVVLDSSAQLQTIKWLRQNKINTYTMVPPPTPSHSPSGPLTDGCWPLVVWGSLNPAAGQLIEHLLV